MTDTDSAPITPTTSRQRRAEFRFVWRTLSFYERFEVAISITLTTLIALIILLATLDLVSAMITLVRAGVFEPLDHRQFQAFFGQIMTLLIALEFKHSIIKAVAHRQNVVQVRTVLLIALLALSRKFIILDLSEYSPMTVMALAASVTALGVTHWLVRARPDRRRPATIGATAP